MEEVEEEEDFRGLGRLRGLDLRGLALNALVDGLKVGMMAEVGLMAKEEGTGAGLVVDGSEIEEDSTGGERDVDVDVDGSGGETEVVMGLIGGTVDGWILNDKLNETFSIPSVLTNSFVVAETGSSSATPPLATKVCSSKTPPALSIRRLIPSFLARSICS
jgi:hypothetical protein